MNDRVCEKSSKKYCAEGKKKKSSKWQLFRNLWKDSFVPNVGI